MLVLTRASFPTQRQMNAKNNSRLLNSLIPPLGVVNSGLNKVANAATNAATNAANNMLNSSKSWMPSVPSFDTSSIPFTPIILVLFIAAMIGLMVYFQNEIQSAWRDASDVISKSLGSSTSTAAPPPPEPVVGPVPQMGETGHPASSTSAIVEKVLPGGGNEVFNVSSNKYTFYDAQPLCKALGAQLASYEQVKEAWNRGADWCNYGWVKGQMAVYPTSDETYQKLQAGPEEQRMACGRPGINGGFFDNPEMRFGVNCYGQKPTQSKHDEKRAEKGAPTSPDALAFDKKVNQFKSEADHIGIMPFNDGKWSN